MAYYSKLDNSNGDIRLLRALPTGNWAFDTHSLNPDTPDKYYMALSYAWHENPADDNNTSKIICIEHGSQVHQKSVTYNLWSFLQRAQQRWPCGGTRKPPYFWIDALCINQADLDERSQQVAMMQSVYFNSLCTLVWLGDIKVEPTWTDAREGAFASKAHFRANIVNIINCRYWARMWTLQEFVLARDLMVCHGPFMTGYPDVLLSILALPETMDVNTARESYIFEQYDSMVSGLQNPHLHVTDQQQRHIQETCRLRSRYEKLRLYLVERWIRSSMGGFVEEYYPTLEEIFYLVAPGRECTDPRDYVYALLGLRLELPMMPDYRLSLTEFRDKVLSLDVIQDKDKFAKLLDSKLGPLLQKQGV